jgi:anthranilate phosphoribosyltransferase
VAGDHGPVRDAVVLNAGAALAVHADEPVEPLDRLRAAIARAEEALDSGAASALLDRWVAVTSSVA